MPGFAALRTDEYDVLPDRTQTAQPQQSAFYRDPSEPDHIFLCVVEGTDEAEQWNGVWWVRYGYKQPDVFEDAES